MGWARCMGVERAVHAESPYANPGIALQVMPSGRVHLAGEGVMC